MAKFYIRNVSGIPQSLTTPYRGVVPGGEAIIVSGEEASIVASLGGVAAIQGVWALEAAPDSVPVSTQNLDRPARIIVADETARLALPLTPDDLGVEIYETGSGDTWLFSGGDPTNPASYTEAVGGGAKDYGGATTTIYQRNTGSDLTGDGSLGNPYATLGRAVLDLPASWTNGYFTFDCDKDLAEVSPVNVKPFLTNTALAVKFQAAMTPLYTIDLRATQSELDLSTLAAGNCTIVVRAGFEHIGAPGDNFQVALVGDNGIGVGVTTVRAGDLLTVHYESGTSTVQDVADGITANGMLFVVAVDSGATVLTSPGDDFAATNLTGGVDAPGPIRVVGVEPTEIAGISRLVLSGLPAPLSFGELSGCVLRTVTPIPGILAGVCWKNLDTTSFAANLLTFQLGFTVDILRPTATATFVITQASSEVRISGFGYTDITANFSRISFLESAVGVVTLDNSSCVASYATSYGGVMATANSTWRLDHCVFDQFNFYIGSTGPTSGYGYYGQNVAYSCWFLGDYSQFATGLPGYHDTSFSACIFWAKYAQPLASFYGPGKVAIAGCTFQIDSGEVSDASGIHAFGPDLTLILDYPSTGINLAHYGAHLFTGVRIPYAAGTPQTLAGVEGELALGGTLGPPTPNAVFTWQEAIDEGGVWDFASDTAFLIRPV